MRFRAALLSDIERMLRIVESAVAYFKAQGIDQWQNGYPNRQSLEADIASGRAFLLEEDGRVEGMAALCFGPEPTYARIENGAWPDDLPYATVHRVAVAPERKGEGLAGELLRFCGRKAAGRGVSRLRSDTHEANAAMRRCLLKAGFRPCGVIRLADGSPRLAFCMEIPPAEG